MHVTPPSRVEGPSSRSSFRTPRAVVSAPRILQESRELSGNSRQDRQTSRRIDLVIFVTTERPVKALATHSRDVPRAPLRATEQTVDPAACGERFRAQRRRV